MGTTVLQIRISTELKEQAEALFAELGLKTSDAVRMFLHQSINTHGLPFQPQTRIPNAETLEAFAESEAGLATPVTLEELKARLVKPQARK